MDIFFQLIKWLSRAWPILVFVTLVIAHMVLLHYFHQSASLIHKVISLLAQLGGGFLILYSIDSNIGVLKKKSLITLLAAYFQEFPLIKRSVTLEVQGLVSTSSLGKAKLTVSRNPNNIEEKIEYLQYQIDEIRSEFEQGCNELNEKIDRQSKEIGAQIQEWKFTLQTLESKVSEVSAGGVLVQLFGVLLMVYGAIAGYMA